MLLESNDHDLADAQNTSTPTCTSFSPQQQHSSMNASSSGASSKVRVQQILLVLLLLLNAISWNFVLFWRHEAFDLRARVAELETECAAAHTAATVAMATAECPTVRTAVIPPLTKSAPPTATLPPHPHLSALIDKLTKAACVLATSPTCKCGKTPFRLCGSCRAAAMCAASCFQTPPMRTLTRPRVPTGPQWYCDKIATTLDPWIEPSGELDVADVVVGVFSGESLFYSRASATSATWSTQIPHTYIYASQPEPTVPVIGIGERYKPSDPTLKRLAMCRRSRLSPSATCICVTPLESGTISLATTSTLSPTRSCACSSNTTRRRSSGSCSFRASNQCRQSLISRRGPIACQ
jgi:hypothetical protein